MDLCPGGARSGEKTADEGQALPPAQPAHLQRQRYIPFDCVMRVERVALEHHGHVACLGPQGVDSSAADRDRARVSCLEAGNDLQEVDFPQPDGPSSDRNSPSCTASETSRRICVLPKDFEI